MLLDRKTWAILGGSAALVIVGAVVLRRRPVQRIALVGDSLAVGLAPQFSKLFAARGIAFKSEAIGGTTPLQWSDGTCGGQCGSWLASFAPDVILVVLGTNDIGYGTPPAAPYQTLVSRWGAIGRVVWVEPPMMPGDKLAAVRRTIESLGVSVYPAQTGLSFGSDGIHPSNYAPWAAGIAASFGA